MSAYLAKQRVDSDNGDIDTMILFTGLTGLSGSALIKVMDKEHFSDRIRIVVRKSSNIDIIKDSDLNYELVYGDVGDHDFMVSVLKDVDIVFHIADKYKIEEVASAIVDANCVKHCFFVSSTSLYSNYRIASKKLADAEEKMKNLFKIKNIAWTIIRPTMIFGNENDHNISTFMGWLYKYPVFPLVKNGEALLQPVNANDLARAYFVLLCNSNECMYNEYIVSGYEEKTLKEILRAIGYSVGRRNVFVNIPFFVASKLVNMAYIISFKKVDYREKLVRLLEDRNFNHDKITEQFGWQPKRFEYWIKKQGCEFLESNKG